MARKKKSAKAWDGLKLFIFRIQGFASAEKVLKLICLLTRNTNLKTFIISTFSLVAGGGTAPTFLIIAFLPVPVHRIGSKEGFTVSNFRFVALALIAGFISLNIIGFCYEKISFFTNGRLIEIGIDRVLSDERNTIPSDITTAEQFLDTFKDCCSASSGQSPIESVLPLILGIRETRVDIGYTFSRDGKTYMSDTTFFLNCCGIVGERWHDTQKM